jgi:hypothetical protein
MLSDCSAKLFGENDMEKISHEDDDVTAWICLCGNTSSSDGFATCNAEGDEIEPTNESEWSDLYVCNDCGRIIDQKNLVVVGRKRMHDADAQR